MPEKHPMTQLGVQVSARCRQLGMTYYGLAAHTDIGYHTLYRAMHRSELPLSVRTARRLADFLDTQPTEIFILSLPDEMHAEVRDAWCRLEPAARTLTLSDPVARATARILYIATRPDAPDTGDDTDVVDRD